MNYLIYLAYGSTDIINEAIYSILTYEEVAVSDPQTSILIYTDKAEAFRQVLDNSVQVIYPTVEPAQWHAWQGTVNRVYLLKIGVLIHAAAHYPGNLFFLDTDTIWRQDPSAVFHQVSQGHFFMHQNEGRLISGNTLSRKVYRHLRGHQWHSGGHTLRITPETELFNSGVIALRSDKAYLLPEVMALAEQLYSTYNKHMMEQLAFSLRFAAEGSIGDVPNYLWHYWNMKQARPAISKLVAASAHQRNEQLLQQLHQLQLPKSHQQELAYRSLPSWRRTLNKLFRRNRNSHNF